MFFRRFPRASQIPFGWRAMPYGAAAQQPSRKLPHARIHRNPTARPTINPPEKWGITIHHFFFRVRMGRQPHFALYLAKTTKRGPGKALAINPRGSDGAENPRKRAAIKRNFQNIRFRHGGRDLFLRHCSAGCGRARGDRRGPPRLHRRRVRRGRSHRRRAVVGADVTPDAWLITFQPPVRGGGHHRRAVQRHQLRHRLFANHLTGIGGLFPQFRIASRLWRVRLLPRGGDLGRRR